MKRLSLLSAALVAAFCVSPLDAQILTPGRRIMTTEQGYAQLDSLAKQALRTRVEQMACVTALILDGDTLVIARTAPAKNVVRADSIGMEFVGPPAEWWQPCVHTHFVETPYRDYPSPADTHSTAARGIYGLLMVVNRDSTWTLRPYP